MIKILPSNSEHVVMVSASGRVDATDYEEVLMPAIEQALAKSKKVRLLYQLGSDFDSLTAGAMWDDMKLGLGHLTAWEKVAVVTDIGWIATAANLFKFAMPCPVRVFANNELSLAQSWIAA
jgi:hypothetical protein